MNDNLRRHYEMLLRVQDFGKKYIVSFPEGFRGRELFMELDTIIAEIERLTTAQQSNERSAREGTTLRGEARTNLSEAMEAMSDTARSVAIETPGLEDKFRMPRGRATDVDLLNVARAFAADALPMKDDFIAHGLPSDFLDKLNSCIETFERAINGQQRSKRERSSARVGLDAAVERGVNKVRQLDAPVRNRFRDNPTVLAEWDAAHHTWRPPSLHPKKKKRQSLLLKLCASSASLSASAAVNLFNLHSPQRTRRDARFTRRIELRDMPNLSPATGRCSIFPCSTRTRWIYSTRRWS